VEVVSEIVKEMPSPQWNKTKTFPDEIPFTPLPPPKKSTEAPCTCNFRLKLCTVIS
jgi:hypothetical protein